MAKKSEFDLLVKCLKMTTSSNEQEAIVAMRKANEQLTKLGWTWEKLLEGKVKVIEDPFGERKAPPSPPPPPQPAPPVWQRPQPQPTSWQADPPYRDPDPVYRDPQPRSGSRYYGTQTGRASSRDPNLSPKPRTTRSRKQSAGNITLDDLGL